MENTSKRRDSLQNQRPEQSIADEDTSVSHPLRVQQQNQSDRQGDVAIESYGGVSPTMSYEKDQPRFNRAIDPQYKFREIYANAQSKPQSKTRKPPEKQYSWIERMNHSVEKVQDKDKGGDANDGLVDKFIDFLNGLGEQPEESHPKDAGYIAQQHGVEFEPSEATYDTAQANNATRGDDTTQDEPTMLASRSSGPISSYKTADMSEFDMSDGQYDNFQQTERLDDNARRNSWSKPSGQQQSGSMQSQSIAFSTQKLPDISMSKSAPSRSHRSSFGTRRNDPYHIQEHPYYPGSASPNWAAGTFAPLETSIPKSRKLSGRHGPDDTPSAHNGRKRSRQESIETLKPSSYLSIPPMIPSEMSLEALLHPSKQVDLLQFDDLGIDTLFDQTINLSDYLSMPPMAPSELSMEALRNPSKQVDLLQFDDLGIDKLFDKTVRPSTYLGIPPMTPSELSMEALRNPSKQVDLLQFDDLGIDKLFDKTVRPSTYLGIPPMTPSELSMEALRNPSKQVDLLQYDDLGIDKLFDKTVRPSTYLGIPPMTPSELSMEALRNPSKQVDLLQYDDLGIDKLFDKTVRPSTYLGIPPMTPSELSMEALRNPSKQVDLLQYDDLGIDKLFDKTVRPSTYLGIPPMIPSELSMEALRNPSKQVDLLQFDDLGIDRLFDQTITPSTYLSILPMAPSKLAMEALRHPSKLFDLLKFDDLGIDKLFGQTIKTSDDLSIPPMVPSELSMEAFRHPSKQVDLLQFDDLGIDTLFDETIKPSDYLSIPPMAPSELSMEPLHHPSKQVDLLQFDDLGIDKLFWTPLATAGKSDLQNIAQKLSQEAAPNYNISKIKPPAVPSSLALECLFNPNPSSADWAWGVDDIGLKDLMSHERTLSHSRTLNEKMNRTHKVDQRPKKTSAVHEATGYQDSLDKIMNRTHKVDQRPKMTSALHEQTDYQSFCIPVVDPRPHALGLSQSSIFDSQDVTGDFDITQSTTGRVHATIQRPKAFQKDERRMGAKSTMVELPPEIYVRDSWSSYMAFKTSQEQPKQHLRYESPGSLARDKFEGQGEGRSQQPSLVQSTLVDVNEAVEQRKRRKREMRAENRKKDWADNMDDSQFETLFPAQFEGSADNVPQSKRSVTDTQHQVAEEPQVPTWTSTSSYGINAPYSLPPFSFESNARETAYPTDEEESKDWKSQNKNKFTMPATTPLHGVKADKDSESQDPQLQMNYKLHGLVDTVASGVGAVAGTAVGALSYWFSDSSHSTEEKPKQSSFSSNTAVNAGDQLYANETEGVQAISVVPDSHLTGAEEQLFMAKKDNPNLALGHVDDDTHVVNLHPSLLRPSERAELSTDQSLGSPGHNGNPSIGPQSELPRSLQYETGRTTKDRDLSSKYASQNIGGGTNADKNEPASDDEIRKLFNGDPDTVRQPFKTNQPHKTTMDDRRQIWEASMSTALGQAATTLGLQPQSKEKTLDLENYHVVNSGYKPSSYEPGRNQFDSDFENWKHDYPTRTSFNEGERKQNEGAQEHASDQAGNADNGQSDDSAQNVTNSSSQISGVPAWERAEFHDPSDYMKDTKSHTQHRHSRQPDPTTASSHHGRGPTGWIRRKLNKRHVRAER